MERVVETRVRQGMVCSWQYRVARSFTPGVFLV